jgi:hypothetical protein
VSSPEELKAIRSYWIQQIFASHVTLADIDIYSCATREQDVTCEDIKEYARQRFERGRDFNPGGLLP